VDEKVMTYTLPRRLLLTVLLSGAPLAQAENLLDIYRLAQQNDLTLAQAQANYQANLERSVQGKGQLLPSVGFNASHFAVNQDMQKPAPGNKYYYDSDAYSLQLTQPLYRKSNFAAYAQGKAIAAQAEAEIAIVRDELMLRSVQAYFDVLSAADTLAFARTEKAAIEGQLQLAERNFAVGNATVVDVHEGRARRDLAVAQEVAADNDLQAKREALTILVGTSPEKLAALTPNLPLQRPDPRDVEFWNKTAQDRNPLIKAQELAVKVTEEEIEKNRGGHYPTLDLVASHGYNTGSNVLSSTLNVYEYTTSQVGVQLQVPLYAGGITQSRVRESEARRDQARAGLDLARRTATRLTREAYLAVTGGITRVQALEQARISSKKALESTLMGYESGVRTGVDVLNSQRDLYRTERDLSQARYVYLLSQLRLKFAAGTLNETDLGAVNALLVDK
jgi:outer membrane protein